ncbi:DUF2207 domain-containing protein [Planococcus sp. ISL-110]|uniref:DUF2207 domain-containing protein n=1 Tax=Planococcus sp. ISL-110 TaxID=2819167 RepID=UPI001BE8FEDD|nr:DUF2207 domain-containing protein [Planococcus sp. ISL-110]MBT2570826.1 DUF2207 domain-containing protein [Planococcus sp. ISL-110]
MNKKKPFMILMMLLVFILFPIQALAVDYSITEVTIDAQVNADGAVEVVEYHTYEFDGDFNGITREIAPKEGTSIQKFRGYENGKKLEVERQGDLYKVFRSGGDETIIIELRYEIQEAIEKFEDGAEFYWPFFDDRNESEYGQLTVSVSPPALADETDFVGYDEAYRTGSLQNDGAVLFEMGTVLEGTNGDVRVVFDAELFPALPQQDGAIRGELADEKERLQNDALAFAARQDTGSSIGNGLIPAAGALLAAMAAWAWNRARKTKQQAKPADGAFFVPKQKMSIPATLYFTKSAVLTPAATAAALMELVRKKNVEQLSEEQFRLIGRNTEFAHEAALIDLLFDKVGDGETFETKDLESYTKNELNHSSYNESIADWQQGVAEEVKQHDLYGKHPVFRWTAGLLGLALFAAAVFFGLLNLFVLMFFSIVFGIFFIAFCFYSPITYEGHVIRQEWKQLRAAMENLDEAAWNGLTPDEKMRAFAYVLGADENSANRNTQSFTNAYSESAFADFGVFYNPVLLTGIFIAANSSSSASASGTGSMSAGGGVGGGGGGSGAF